MRTVSNFVIALALLVSAAIYATRPVTAQAAGNGVFVLLQAGTPASCVWPAGATVTNGMAICATTSGPYYALNGSATFLPFANSATVTGTTPIVVTGTAVSCPTCVTGSVVTSFNSRSGAIQLTKADVLGTNFAVSTSSTSTVQ